MVLNSSSPQLPRERNVPADNRSDELSAFVSYHLSQLAESNAERGALGLDESMLAINLMSAARSSYSGSPTRTSMFQARSSHSGSPTRTSMFQAERGAAISLELDEPMISRVAKNSISNEPSSHSGSPTLTSMFQTERGAAISLGLDEPSSHSDALTRSSKLQTERGAAISRGLDESTFCRVDMNSASAAPSFSSGDRTIPVLNMVQIVEKFSELDNSGVLSSSQSGSSANELFGLIVTEALNTMGESYRFQAREMMCDCLSAFLSISLHE